MNITGFLFRHELESTQIIRLIPVYNIELKDPGFEWNQWTIAIAVLITGMLIMGVRMLLQLLSLHRIKTKATLLNEGTVKLFHVDEQITPFSFSNGIYINRQLHTEAELKEIIRHEFVHVKQKHSIDILFAELLCMLLWFHPAAWLIRNAIRQNLEFIADEQVLQDGVDKKQYQYLLLKVVGNSHYSIAPNFNFSSLKNRIIMMNQMKSARVQAIRFLFVLPLIAVLLLAFRQVKENKIAAAANPIVTDTVPPPPPPALPTEEQWMKSANENIASIDVTKKNGQQQIKITLKNGTVENYDLNDPKQKEAFEKKYGKLKPVIETVDVKKKNGENTVTLRLSDGQVQTFDLNDPQQRIVLEKDFGFSEAGDSLPAPAAPPIHRTNQPNSKGYIVTIADNAGECIVIVKDKQQKIVTALTLTDWLKKEKQYEKQYGEIPPPPPPPPYPPKVRVEKVTVVSPKRIKTAPVSAMSPESKVLNETVEVEIIAVEPAQVQERKIKTRALKEGKLREQKIKEIELKEHRLNEQKIKERALKETRLSEQRIRLTTSQNQEPVYYIDGKEATKEEIEKLNPAMIESINVIKDEQALKIYGEKAKGGVILIRTKK